MTDIADLIKRLKEAEDGSRDLDAEIALSLLGSVGRPEQIWGCIIDGLCRRGWQNDSLEVWDDQLPHYTTSLDAALTLVPEGYYWSFDSRGCCVVAENKMPPEEDENWQHVLGHSVPAIALCIAALKARAA